jgi:hypothetical protein
LLEFCSFLGGLHLHFAAALLDSLVPGPRVQYRGHLICWQVSALRRRQGRGTAMWLTIVKTPLLSERSKNASDPFHDLLPINYLAPTTLEWKLYSLN